MTHIRAPFGRWDPAPLSELAAMFSGLDCHW